MDSRRPLPIRGGRLLVLAMLISVAVPLAGQSGARNGEWRVWGADNATSHYSPLDQINRDNVKDLQVAWRWKSENMGPRPHFEWKGSPLMVDGVLYATTGSRRNVVAIDAATGETLWMFRYDEGKRGAHGGGGAPTARGLAYWTDGKGDERLLYITLGYRLVALNPKTGRPIPSFGKDGTVDLFQGFEQNKTPTDGDVLSNSPPGIVGDVVVVGAAIQPAAGSTMEALGGFPRGFDVRTGKQLWAFRTIPRPGEVGNETWEDDSWFYTGHAGIWTQVAADEELGYVYLGTDDATNDYYGGHRPGANLFSTTILCLEAETGKRVWHYQIIHHDIWDYDIQAAPNLVDVTIDGRERKVLALASKTGFLYVLDRVTGEPIWPIEERSTPRSNVPGEEPFPTQPHPTKPAPFAKQGITEDDLIDFTPELRTQALAITKKYRIGPIYTPAEPAPGGTLMLPSPNGGASWQGAAHDPETSVLYVGAANTPRVLRVTHDPKRSDMDFIGSARFLPELYPQGLPLLKPPYGQINAIDLNTGETLWVIPNGDTPDHIKNHPALKGVKIPRTGSSDAAGLLLTKTLLFAGVAGTHSTLPPRQGQSQLLAIDKQTGDVIFEYDLPDGLRPTGVPITYMLNGKQYIALFASASPPATTYRLPGELVALTLP